MRLKNYRHDPRLLIVDAPAQDAATEADIFSTFLENRAGKTTVLASHRVGAFVHEADLIL